MELYYRIQNLVKENTVADQGLSGERRVGAETQDNSRGGGGGGD